MKLSKTFYLALFTVWALEYKVFVTAAESVEPTSCDSETIDKDVSVETVTGLLKGKLVHVPGSTQLVAEFRGIPYAEPPIRFQDSEPKRKWNGVYEAFEYGNHCIQSTPLFVPEIAGFKWLHDLEPDSSSSEDCLFLDVYAPYPFLSNATVMVYIHGGYFFLGAGGMQFYNGKIMARLNDVIVITINYRLAAFGFLSSGDGRIKGNFGLKDQLLALKWVNENIHAFGGDPNSVTLFGSSAGGASSGYHLLSPLSINLFNRAILQSGSPNGVWAFMPKELVSKRFQDFLAAVNCPDDANLLNCLHQLSVDDINLKQWIKGETAFDMPWFPSVDGEFLTDLPLNLLKVGSFKKTQIMAGVDKNEGTLFLAFHIPGFSVFTDSLQTKEQYIKNIEELQPPLPPFVLELIKFYYTDWNNPYSPERNRDALDDIYGDAYFTCSVSQFADFYTKQGLNIYYFVYGHKSSVDLWPEWAGVIHMAEIEMIFGHPLNKSKGFSDDERELSKKMMAYFTNFAKYGDPNGNKENFLLPEWPLYTSNEQSYLNIHSPANQKIEYKYRASYCEFWNSLIPKLLKDNINKP